MSELFSEHLVLCLRALQVTLQLRDQLARLVAGELVLKVLNFVEKRFDLVFVRLLDELRALLEAFLVVPEVGLFDFEVLLEQQILGSELVDLFGLQVYLLGEGQFQLVFHPGLRSYDFSEDKRYLLELEVLP